MEVYNGLLFFFVVGTIIGGRLSCLGLILSPVKNGLRNCSVMKLFSIVLFRMLDFRTWFL